MGGGRRRTHYVWNCHLLLTIGGGKYVYMYIISIYFYLKKITEKKVLCSYTILYIVVVLPFYNESLPKIESVNRTGNIHRIN